jgi:hypothetical protein
MNEQHRLLTDPELLYAANLSASRFAAEVLGLEAGKVQSWLAGDCSIPLGIRAVCAAIVDRPELARQISGDDALAGEMRSRKIQARVDDWCRLKKSLGQCSETSGIPDALRVPRSTNRQLRVATAFCETVLNQCAVHHHRLP